MFHVAYVTEIRAKVFLLQVPLIGMAGGGGGPFNVGLHPMPFENGKTTPSLSYRDFRNTS